MKKKIAILGSTGSIGKSLLNILSKDKKKFEVILLTANKNYKLLLKQVKKFEVKNVIIKDLNSYKKFKKQNKNNRLNIYNNFRKLDLIFKKKIDYVMSAIVGLEGLEPTLKIIQYTKSIAIANKESIICGWNLIKNKLKKNKTDFIPVDSEHFSIWYALKNNNLSNVNKIILTASGGSLLNLDTKKINNVSVKDVLNHPNWKMGKKITIDSSTLINKVFEVIEAKNIFDISLRKLSILIHPASYIHSIIYFKDGMIKIIAHETTMEIPIINSIYKNNINKYEQNDVNISKLNNLNFSLVDKHKFPAVEILKYIPNKISLFETVLVSANDELVRLYLNKKIKYKDIIKLLIKIIKIKEFKKLNKIKPKNISQIINLDKYVRLKINSKSV